ncbi:hypothetical protein HYPSUDRAFT_35652 [Hypholoma sublateritium FD-334 SS-4]|uniref:Replication protein A C-terminal domain-containing protein n=1 Tax=Hypholoma sublateritium (strain FD-334 SS-4) TaxID=945553 RepID=A0A0D2MSW5_HYPSF|nr:hypothetical protein HYPSUDRAFT_35652 [Hypholoma sublateritium FD-334 SS-4]
MAPLSQSFSFSSVQGGSLSSSQYAQNSSPNAAEALRRVTIRQLLRATETGNLNAPFEIDGHEIRRVMLVANIFHEDAGSGIKVTYGLDDGTGRINGHFWSVNGDETDEPQFSPFAYARVTGELSVFKTSRNLRITQIVPIDGPYEVYFHTLGVIFETVALDKGLPPQHILRELSVVNEVNTLSQDLAQKTSILDQGFSPTNNHLENTTYSQPGASSSRLVTASPPLHTLDHSTLTPLERDIVNCIDDKSTDENIETGVHVADFIPDIKELNPELTSTELSEVFDSLVTRGILQASPSNEYYRCIS